MKFKMLFYKLLLFYSFLIHLFEIWFLSYFFSHHLISATFSLSQRVLYIQLFDLPFLPFSLITKPPYWFINKLVRMSTAYGEKNDWEC